MKTMERLIATIIICALLAGLFVLGQRFADDRNNRTVQLVMDYTDLYSQRNLWQVPLPTYLGELKERGMVGVVLRESTVGDMVLRGTISVVSGQEMLAQLRMGMLNIPDLGEPAPWESFVFGDDLAAMARLQAELVRQYGASRVRVLSMSEPWGIEIQGGRENLMNQRIGFLQEDLETIRESGLDIVPVLYNYGRISGERFEEIIQELEQYGRVFTVLFDGARVVGYPNTIDQTALSMNYRNMILGLLQPADTLLGYSPLAGTEDLLGRIQNRGARVYMVSRGITGNIHTQGMVNRWLNSIREFNIHVLYLRPFYSGATGESAAQRNLNYIDTLTAEIYEAGYETGAYPSYPEVNMPHPLLRALLMWAVGAAGLYWFGRFYQLNVGIQYFTLCILGLVAVGTVYVSQLEILLWVWALGGAILFPVLALTLLLQKKELVEPSTGKPVCQIALSAWAGTTLVTICGIVLVAAMLTTPRFILDVDYFRGVKFSYIAPLGLVPLIFYWFSEFTRERSGCLIREVKELLGRAVTFRDMIIVMVLLAFLVFYLLRSGNMEISPLESTVREWLDRALFVRPRTKEFLVGHPFLILAVAAALKGQRKLLPVLFALGTIGQISIMNTFMHIRTPLLESIIRTLNGLWLGALVGLMLIGVWNQADRYLVTRKAKKDPQGERNTVGGTP
jgi:hypothetical protein